LVLNFAPLVDKFVEIFIGKYNVKPNVDIITITNNLQSNNLQSNYDNMNKEYLTKKRNELQN
jgi:hypothetical protein